MQWYETQCMRVLRSSLLQWLSHLAPIGVSSQLFSPFLALFGGCLTKNNFLLKISPATRSIAPKFAGASYPGFFDTGQYTHCCNKRPLYRSLQVVMWILRYRACLVAERSLLPLPRPDGVSVW